MRWYFGWTKRRLCRLPKSSFLFRVRGLVLIYNSELRLSIMSSLSLCCLLRVSDEFHIMDALLELVQPLDDPLQPVRKYLDRVWL